MNDLIYRSAVDLAADIRARRLSPVEAVQSSIDRIEALNPVLNCFCFTYLEELARTVGDAALFMNVAAGPYERDMMSLPDKLDFSLASGRDIAGMNIALSVDLGYYAVDTEVESAVRSAAGALAERGANVIEVDLSWGRHINDAWFDQWGVYLDVCFTKDFEQWRDQMDPNVVALIEHGRSLSAVELKRGEVIRTEQWHKLCRIFERYDALICPTTAHPAPRLGMSDADFQDDAGDGRYRGLDMTCPFNFISQCPVISVPVGFSAEKLPLGMQIVGHRFDDLTVMQVAGALEQALPWSHTHPPI